MPPVRHPGEGRDPFSPLRNLENQNGFQLSPE
jgi:hypothetical protein